MDTVLHLLTAFGISAPAGLNAYLTLLTVGLLGRFTSLLKLNQPFDLLTNEWVLVALGVLVVIEMFADKIAGIDHLNDLLGTVIRPAAGAILFASTTNAVTEVNPVFAFIVGLVAAGSVHAVKATARPVVTATTFGIGNPVVSVLEDILAVATVLLAVIVPILGLALLLVALLILSWMVVRRNRRAAARKAGLVTQRQ
jgi:hypothetical protein